MSIVDKQFHTSNSIAAAATAFEIEQGKERSKRFAATACSWYSIQGRGGEG